MYELVLGGGGGDGTQRELYSCALLKGEWASHFVLVGGVGSDLERCYFGVLGLRSVERCFALF